MIDQLPFLLPLLRCPACHTAPLELTAGPYPSELPFSLTDSHLTCPHCADKYPITYDHIPVMWTPELRQQISAGTKNSGTPAKNYAEQPRQLAKFASRVQDAVQRIFAFQTGTIHSTRFHLNPNCGRGHLIGWLREFNLVSIGLDASLANLRKTRQATDAQAVCGDPASLPFIDGAFDLVTESGTLHHTAAWESVVHESSRVCQPNGGILLDNEPSLGIPLDRLQALFEDSGYELHLFFSPGANLDTTAVPGLKDIMRSVLSLRNPFNPRYGTFTAIAMQADAPLAKGKQP